jgi:hypothetical protein
VNILEKIVVTSLNDSTKYIAEFIDHSKKGHHVTYQKRIIGATQSE